MAPSTFHGGVTSRSCGSGAIRQRQKTARLRTGCQNARQKAAPQCGTKVRFPNPQEVTKVEESAGQAPPPGLVQPREKTP
jgi:hypothetical protein